MNKRMNKIEAEFRVNGSCVTHHAIAEQLGGITLMSLPGNPFNFANPTSRGDFTYAKKIDGGLVTIAFSEENRCVTRFEFHTPVSKYELKKLEEADMRAPEEVQKKSDLKP